MASRRFTAVHRTGIKMAVHPMSFLAHHPLNHVHFCHLKNLPTNNATQVALLRHVILREYAAEYGPVRGSQRHDVLVLSQDGQVDKGQARQVPPVLLTAVLG